MRMQVLKVSLSVDPMRLPYQQEESDICGLETLERWKKRSWVYYSNNSSHMPMNMGHSKESVIARKIKYAELKLNSNDILYCKYFRDYYIKEIIVTWMKNADKSFGR